MKKLVFNVLLELVLILIIVYLLYSLFLKKRNADGILKDIKDRVDKEKEKVRVLQETIDDLKDIQRDAKGKTIEDLEQECKQNFDQLKGGQEKDE